VSVVLWVFALIFSAVLAVGFGRAGWLKTFTPIVQLAGSGLVWVTDIPRWSVRTIGVVELVVAAVVVSAPSIRLIFGESLVWKTAGIAAALGIALLMIAAHLFHTIRGEAKHTWMSNLAFGALACLTASAQFVAG
jgi:hypothetical protein